MEDNENAKEEAKEEASRGKAEQPRHSAEVLEIFHELENFFGDELAKKLIAALSKLPEKIILALWWGANQDREIYYKDIAEYSGVSVRCLHRELAAVVESGAKKSGQHLMPLRPNKPRNLTDAQRKRREQRQKAERAERARKQRAALKEAALKYKAKRKLKRELKEKWLKDEIDYGEYLSQVEILEGGTPLKTL